jgi:chemotaxis protein MotB
MAEESVKQPIIIKKIKKGGHGHHGGAWKIAYADFVTAMMAFFLLLWLLNSVTQESLEGISNFFAPVSTSQTTSGSGDILGGKTITEEGVAESATARDSVTVDLPPPRAGTGGDLSEGEAESKGQPTEEDVEAQAAKKEQQAFEDAQEELEKTLESVPQMRQLKNSLLVDNTPEGLRIQLIDRDGLAMFPSGSAKMFLHTERLLELVSKVILEMPQNVSISGHTDATPFANPEYGNWELSADRANSARRALEGFGVPDKRINQVVGKSATEPLIAEDPKHPSNRRLSIILLRGTGREAEKAKAEEKAKQERENEVLPGLNEIKRQQRQEDGGTGAPGAQPGLPAAGPNGGGGGQAPAPQLPGINLEIRGDITSQ